MYRKISGKMTAMNQSREHGSQGNSSAEGSYHEGPIEDGLKKINDTLGHKAGDEYIRSACEMLCRYFKHSPVFRIGGDEFVVLLQGGDYEARETILREFNALIEENIREGRVVASLGLAVYDHGKDQSFHEAFKRADDLMYERKMQLKSMGAVTRD